MNCQDPDCTAQMTWFRGYVLNRPGYHLEGRWYCSEACLERGVERRLAKRRQSREAAATSPFQIKIEHMLLANGAITRDQLAKAFAAPMTDPHATISRHLIDLGFVTERDITQALSRLFSIPVINLKSRRIDPNVLNLIPVEIVRNHRFFPLEFEANERRLVLVTHDPADLSMMVNLRGILDCQVAIYLSDESVVRNMVEQYCDLSERVTLDESVGSPNALSSPREVAHWIVRRAKTIDARSLQVCRLDEFIWTRFVVGHTPRNLVVSAHAV